MHLWGWLRVFLLLTATLGGVVAHAERVHIVLSESQPAFQEASQALVEDLTRVAGITKNDVRVVPPTDTLRSDWVQDDTRLVVTLGARAFSQVMASGSKVPVIAALIPRLGFERVLAQQGKKAGSTITALYLDQPFSRQLSLLRAVLPSARVVGVVWGPESVALRGQLQASLKATGLQLRESEMAATDTLVTALKTALTDADALLAVPDSQVFNAATVSNILMLTYRARVPVVAFSPSYAKAGAVVSVYTSTAQVGMQAATMAASFLQTGQLPGSEYPTEFEISVNEYVARSLGLSIDSKRLSAQLAGQEKRP